MIMFAVIFLTFLILIKIPVIKEITIIALILCVISFLFGWGYFFNIEMNKSNQEGIRR